MKERLQFVLKRIFILFIILLAYLIIYQITGIGLPCLFNKITGLNCPGCGITRMFISLFHFDIKGAIDANLLVFMLLPFGFGVGAYKLVKFIKYGNSNDPIWLKISYFAIAVITIVFGIIRNLSFFSFLAPH